MVEGRGRGTEVEVTHILGEGRERAWHSSMVGESGCLCPC